MSERPNIGEIVHYVSYGSKDGRYESTCRAAIVTETHESYKDPTSRGLATLNPTGVFFDRDVRQSEEKHTGGTWHWPCVPTTESKDN
jgi:hypothetical protein